MRIRGFWEQIFFALLLNIILKTGESVPLRETRIIKGKEHRPPASNGHENKAGVDIFEIILRANIKRKKSMSPQLGMRENVAPNDGKLFQGDIVMSEDIREALENSHTDVMTIQPSKESSMKRRWRRAVTANIHQKWPIVNGRVEVPYVMEGSLSDPAKKVIVKAMNHWHTNVPCIEFVSRTRQSDYLSFFSGQGCFSWVGRKGRKQRISIGSECAVMGVVAHEIGHALGFWHEQARPDRDKYVRILWDNILSDNLDDFKKINGSDTNDLGVQYDLASLMHYGPKAFAKNPSVNTIESLDGSTNFGQRNGLSDKDIEQARLLYCPRTNACKTLYSDLHQDCAYWGTIKGYCDDKDQKAFMDINCKQTCICKMCEDKNPGCSSHVAAGYCTNDSHRDWMALNCRKSCQLCS